MTGGMWACPKCAHEQGCYLSEFVARCPSCGTEFELIEHLQGAHISHTVPIWKISGEDVEYSNMFVAFAGGFDQEALERYFTALSNVQSSTQRTSEE